MVIRIAFGCTKCAGKTTAAHYLRDKYGGKVVSFATPLKDILAYAQRRCGLPQQKDRAFLQWLGTEWGRQRVDADLWVKLAMREIDDGNVFIDDVRFPNEFEALQKRGFTLVRIVRGDHVDNHASENALKGVEWPHTIVNEGSLEEFFAALDALVDACKTGHA